MKIFTTIFLSLALVSFTGPATTDYKKIFGSRYEWAVNWLRQNERLIHEYALAFGLPEKELKAIVFPELIRYNHFFNALEIESLKFLYVSEGREYADFSVGFFQMKPSFAEMIEADAYKLLPEKFRQASGWMSSGAEDESSRRERVKRLGNTRHQLLYLCAFYKICELRFKEKNFAERADKVKLFATCYNAGYRRSEESLLSYFSKNNFYSYNYASVSTYYYLHE